MKRLNEQSCVKVSAHTITLKNPETGKTCGMIRDILRADEVKQQVRKLFNVTHGPGGEAYKCIWRTAKALEYSFSIDDGNTWNYLTTYQSYGPDRIREDERISQLVEAGVNVITVAKRN